MGAAGWRQVVSNIQHNPATGKWECSCGMSLGRGWGLFPVPCPECGPKAEPVGVAPAAWVLDQVDRWGPLSMRNLLAAGVRKGWQESTLRPIAQNLIEMGLLEVDHNMQMKKVEVPTETS